MCKYRNLLRGPARHGCAQPEHPRSWQHKQSCPPPARVQHPTCGAASRSRNSHTQSAAQPTHPQSASGMHVQANPARQYTSCPQNKLSLPLSRMCGRVGSVRSKSSAPDPAADQFHTARAEPPALHLPHDSNTSHVGEDTLGLLRSARREETRWALTLSRVKCEARHCLGLATCVTAPARHKNQNKYSSTSDQLAAAVPASRRPAAPQPRRGSRLS